MKRFLGIAFAALAALTITHAAQAKSYELLNVSYDPTRELYKALNAAFIPQWKAQHAGDDLTINMSHGGSGKQARAVIDGLQADVVTLALAADIDAIVTHTGRIAPNWIARLPSNSAPYTSTIVFLTRKGNPWHIRDWGDLVKAGIQVVAPNPKTSGGARWVYLSAWAWAIRQPGGTPDKARAFVQELYKHVPVLDTGARGSTTTFAQRGIGDVLLCWENEAYLALDEFGAANFQVVTPPISMLAEPNVAVVDKNVDAHGTRAVAEAYLKFLYTPAAQEIIARNHYRPRDAAVAAKYTAQFPRLTLISIDDPMFGGWTKTQKEHFDDGGVFDQITAHH